MTQIEVRVTRRLWIAAAVWVIFWSLYPTFGRPRAFRTAIRTGASRLEACNPIAAEQARRNCWQTAGGNMQQSLDAITLHNEYAGYAPVWFGVGFCVPMAGALVLVMSKRQRLA